MRSSKLLLALLLSALLTVLSGTYVVTKNTGAPIANGFGYTGGIRENGRNCTAAGCHVGSAQQRDGMITSDVSVDGYHSGVTYQITVTISQPPRVKYGFQASPQAANGDVRGSLASLDGTAAIPSGGINYTSITHTQNGMSAPSQTKTWTFNWTAPAQIGLGEVYFFVACNASNSNNHPMGDQIFLDTLIISEALANGIAAPQQVQAVAFPNPTSDLLSITISVPDEHVECAVFDLNGRQVMPLTEITLPSSGTLLIDVGDLSPGSYIVELSTSAGPSYLRVLCN